MGGEASNPQKPPQRRLHEGSMAHAASVWVCVLGVARGVRGAAPAHSARMGAASRGHMAARGRHLGGSNQMRGQLVKRRRTPHENLRVGHKPSGAWGVDTPQMAPEARSLLPDMESRMLTASPACCHSIWSGCGRALIPSSKPACGCAEITPASLWWPWWVCIASGVHQSSVHIPHGNKLTASSAIVGGSVKPTTTTTLPALRTCLRP